MLEANPKMNPEVTTKVSEVAAEVAACVPEAPEVAAYVPEVSKVATEVAAEVAEVATEVAEAIPEVKTEAAKIIAKLERVCRSTEETITLPNVIDLPVDEEKDLLIGRFPPGEYKHDLCDTLKLDSLLVPMLLSKMHAYFMMNERGEHFFRDLDSLNGTYLNGNIIPKDMIKLKEGDVIGFGGPSSVSRNGRMMKNPFVYRYTVVGNQTFSSEHSGKKRVGVTLSPRHLHSVSANAALVALSRSQKKKTKCESCRRWIPPKVLRIKASEGSNVAFYHPTIHCLRRFGLSIKMKGVVFSAELNLKKHAQEKRVMNGVVDFFSDCSFPN